MVTYYSKLSPGGTVAVTVVFRGYCMCTKISCPTLLDSCLVGSFNWGVTYYSKLSPGGTVSVTVVTVYQKKLSGLSCPGLVLFKLAM